MRDRERPTGHIVSQTPVERRAWTSAGSKEEEEEARRTADDWHWDDDENKKLARLPRLKLLEAGAMAERARAVCPPYAARQWSWRALLGSGQDGHGLAEETRCENKKAEDGLKWTGPPTERCRAAVVVVVHVTGGQVVAAESGRSCAGPDSRAARPPKPPSSPGRDVVVVVWLTDWLAGWRALGGVPGNSAPRWSASVSGS